MNAIDILLDAASRPLDVLVNMRGKLTPQILNEHLGGHDNSVAWLLWHTGREIDVQLMHLSKGEEVWIRDGFRERFGLGEIGDGVGYGHSPEEARAVVVNDPQLLVDYVTATSNELTRYIEGLDESALSDVVAPRWNPPVTRGVRLVSIIDDALQHLAQAAYVCGLPSRF